MYVPLLKFPKFGLLKLSLLIVWQSGLFEERKITHIEAAFAEFSAYVRSNVTVV